MNKEKIKCSDTNCDKSAVTFHGISQITHGYCYEHRCCGKCGLKIIECDCKSGVPTEREVYNI